LRAAHLHSVRAALEDHVARVEWPRERIDRYRTERLRALLAHARERSPFHAARMGDVDPSSATVGDLARLPPMVKQEAQAEWDAIVTVPGLQRAPAERILNEQRWFSYTPSGQKVFSSGGSSGVRGVYVWDWELFVTLACLAWRMQAREERLSRPPVSRRGSRCSRPESRPTRATACTSARTRWCSSESTIPESPSRQISRPPARWLLDPPARRSRSSATTSVTR
jgi:phenylacetate-CoA ligase